jgi:peptide/nickel transport system ATP-binding protein
MDPLLDVSALTVAYGQSRALDDVSLRIHQGEVVGVVGESGSGKTTLALAILGLLPATARVVAGDVRFNGTSMLRAPAETRRRLRGPGLSMIFQNPRTSFDPVHTVGDHLIEGLRAHQARRQKPDRGRAVEALRDVELPAPEEQMHRYPHQLSGGMRQRSMIALALEHRPQLVLADEPTTALDVTIQAQILDLMGRLTAAADGSGAAFLLVSHNLGVVRAMCTRVVVMYGGRVVEEGLIDRVFSEPRHPYTRALLRASPGIRSAELDPGIPGEPVDIADLPPGCAFAPRCPNRIDRCTKELPPLVDIGQRAVRCWVGVNGALPLAGEQRSEFAAEPPADDPAPDGPDVVSLDRVTKTFRVSGSLLPGGGRQLTAVRCVSLRLRRGEAVGLVGESGSGKSTLGRLVLGLLQPNEGSIRVDGADPSRRSSRARREQFLQAVFQDPHSSLDPRLTVGSSIQEPLRSLGWNADRRMARVREVLAEVRLPVNFAGRFPSELSGGQAQRVAIARAIAPNPGVLLLDEPTAALDVSTQAHILGLLADLQVRHGLSYLFISHDLAAIRRVVSRVAVMYLGAIVEEAPVAELFEQPRHPYTVALLSAVPDADRGANPDRIILAGEPPSPADVPSGCAFHTRCPVAQSICAVESPPLIEIDGRLTACHFPGSLAMPVSAVGPGPAPKRS